jgi:hypothetical protein
VLVSRVIGLPHRIHARILQTDERQEVKCDNSSFLARSQIVTSG